MATEPAPNPRSVDRAAELEELLKVPTRAINVTPDEVVYLVNRPGTKFIDPEYRGASDIRAEYRVGGERSWVLVVWLKHGLRGLLIPYGVGFGGPLDPSPGFLAERFMPFPPDAFGGMRANRDFDADLPPHLRRGESGK